MKPSGVLPGIFALAACATQGALAQGTSGTYTDPETGIIFATETFPETSTEGGYTWGLALPADAETANATEYLGLIVGSTVEGSGWTGVSHGGQMPSSLLLLSWVDGTEVQTSFRHASGYVPPVPYTGDATLTQISASVNDTSFQLIYRCENCWSWDQDGVAGGQDTSSGSLLIGWAQCLTSPTEPSNPDSDVEQHDNGFGIFGATVADAVQEEYDSWAAAF